MAAESTEGFGKEPNASQELTPRSQQSDWCIVAQEAPFALHTCTFQGADAAAAAAAADFPVTATAGAAVAISPTLC
jgi:hypothetical protein